MFNESIALVTAPCYLRLFSCLRWAFRCHHGTLVAPFAILSTKYMMIFKDSLTFWE